MRKKRQKQNKQNKPTIIRFRDLGDISIKKIVTSPKKLVQPRKAPAHHQNGTVEPLPEGPEGIDMISAEQYQARRIW